MTSLTHADLAEQIKLAAEAFLYGYPLVYNLREIAKFPAGPNLVGPQALPYNTFGYARRLLDPKAHFVSPNNDTLYLVAMCDVRSGPLVLHVPDTNDRYYVLQFVDAWTNNFAYIGRRATGTAAGQYLLAARGYSGPAPEGMPVVHAPSGVFADRRAHRRQRRGRFARGARTSGSIHAHAVECLSRWSGACTGAGHSATRRACSR